MTTEQIERGIELIKEMIAKRDAAANGDRRRARAGASPPASTGRTEQGHGCCAHRGGGEGAQAEEAQGAIPYERVIS